MRTVMQQIEQEREAREAARFTKRTEIGGILIEEACPNYSIYADSPGCFEDCVICGGRERVLTSDGRRLMEIVKFWLLRGTNR